MKLKSIEELNVPLDEPFKFDLFSRKPQIEYLTNIVENISHPFVLSIHGTWGTGKTSFLRMWKAHLVTRKVKTIYYNAWLNDYSQDPFLDIVSEIANSMGKEKPAFIEKAKSLGKYILKKSIPVTAKIMTAGMIDLSEITEGALSDAVEKAVEEGINNHEASKNSVEEFRKALTKCVEAEKTEGENKNIVFFIDELDRCRPTYAVEVLERIKHFFNVTGMVFVICNDSNQLFHSVKNLYGEGTDADSYLRKFFDLEFSLPIPDKDAFIRSKFAEIDFETIEKFRNYNPRRIIRYAIWIDKLMKTTPREISHIVRLFYLTSFSLNMEEHGFPIDLILFLHFLKIKHPSVFENYSNCKMKLEDITKAFDFQPVDQQNKEFLGSLLVKLEFSITDHSKFEETVKKYPNHDLDRRGGGYLEGLMPNHRQRSECFAQEISRLVKNTSFFQ